MADVFFALSQADRRDGLEVAAARSGRGVHLLEKDVWVVWTLNALLGDVIDYDAAVMGALHLAPDGPAEQLLAADYAGMVKDGLLFEKPPTFAELVARCRAIQDRANNISVSP